MRGLLFAAIAIVLLATGSRAREVQPSLPAIPGLTVEDRFPGACVDCHIVVPDGGMDERLSTRLRGMSEQVDPTMLARVRAVLPASTRIMGRHPRLANPIFQNIPANCFTCHRQMTLPQLGPMLHAIHLTGASGNRYVTLFGGQCTNCHKFNAINGRWSIPSGAEK